MGRIERMIVIWALAYMAVYMPFFFAGPHFLSQEQFFRFMVPLHFLGMAQNLIALILTIRDLYKRPFPHENQKLTWALLITCTGGIGWLIYVFKYALKPRPTRSELTSNSRDVGQIADDQL